MSRSFTLEEVGLETVARCPVCRSAEHVRVFDARDTLHGLPGEWTVRLCSSCGHGFTSPRPDRDSVSLYYPEDYSPFSSPVAPPPNSLPMRWLKSISHALLDPREILMPPIEPGRALEVGCGSGRFLAELTQQGWKVQGLEPSSATAARAAASLGLRVDCGTIENAEYANGEFDLVIGLMVLEHLHDPLADARRIAAWIRPGGFFLGSVPNAACWEFQALGSDWFALQVPTHLSHFTPASLARLLIDSGFDPPTIVHQRNVSNLMVHLGRALERRGWPLSRLFLDYPVRGPLPLRLAVWPLATLLAAARQGGRMTFLTQKPLY